MPRKRLTKPKHGKRLTKPSGKRIPRRLGGFYVLRYMSGTPFVMRGHTDTLGQWATAEQAERARKRRQSADVLEVVFRPFDKGEPINAHKIGKWKS